MTSKQEAKKVVKDLIERFKERKAKWPHKKISEIETQITLINELFEALGWDTFKSGRNTDDEVDYEPKAGAGRVDYAFKLDGIIQFVLEAKKVHTNLDDTQWWTQAIVYGYSSGVSFSVLTNFERLIIFTTEEDNSPKKVVLLDLSIDEYLSSFDKLWWLSKEGVRKKLLYSEARARRVIRKRVPIGDQLYQDILHWHDKLFKDIKSNNSRYEKYAIESMIQIILNRFIFIRTCEDRGYTENLLKSKILEWKKHPQKHLIPALRHLFVHFRQHYKSWLFDDDSCDHIIISDNVLFKIIWDLYFSRAHELSYDFAHIPIDVMGEVYELYIGHLIKQTSEGIYFTPDYIVDYIVEKTIEGYISDGNKLANVRILDPACGSGSFLLAALKELIERQHNTAHKNVKYADKEKILLRSIFAVDKDERAAEIAKLNLSLMTLSEDKALPSFEGNVKVGNSIVDDPQLEGDKAFKWQTKFRNIMDADGFDIIIGNPPYLNIIRLSQTANWEGYLDYYRQKYPSCAHKRFDIYVMFLKKGLELLKNGGYLGMIIPYPFLSQDYAEKFRNELVHETKIIQIVDLSKFKLFKKAVVQNIIIIFQKCDNINQIKNNKVEIIIQKEDPKIIRQISGERMFITQKDWMESPSCEFRIISASSNAILNKIKMGSLKLSTIMVTAAGARGINPKKFHLDRKVNEFCHKMVKGRNIDRYHIEYDGKWFLYDEKKLYRPAFKELFENEKIIIAEVTGEKGLIAAYDNKNYYTDHSLICAVQKHNLAGLPQSFMNKRKIQLTPDDAILSRKYSIKYLLGLINSKLTNYFFKETMGYNLNVYPDDVSEIPVKTPTEEQQKKVVALVDKALDLNNKRQRTGEPSAERTRLNKYIDDVENQIDEIIYEIYKIKPNEKELIEKKI